jgi:hypothetical protein
MYLPDPETENLIFTLRTDLKELSTKFESIDLFNKGGDFSNVDWLNTPGPIYTTSTDNCGTGQIEAINNVGGDENYYEVIFKQPMNMTELDATMAAAFCDPLDGYYFDGNLNWNADNIINWWDKSKERINYIIERYKNELELKVFKGRLYGPRNPIPENYKSWLDFYQFHLKNYLEWYVYKIQNKKLNLTLLKYDWTKRKELDALYKSKFLDK